MLGSESCRHPFAAPVLFGSGGQNSGERGVVDFLDPLPLRQGDDRRPERRGQIVPPL